MPTTPQEAMEIINIVTKYVGAEQAARMAYELREKVGCKSENQSVRETFEMLAHAFDSKHLTSPPERVNYPTSYDAAHQLEDDPYNDEDICP
jgi:capsular polysaccharide biosynthesis protein